VLTESECSMGVQVGIARRLASIKSGLSNYHKVNKTDRSAMPWDADIEGSLAELAVAKYLGCYWDGSVNNFLGADIEIKGLRLQVRQTSYPEGHLIIHDKDRDNDIFILVIGTIPEYAIIGWLYGHEGKKNPTRTLRDFNKSFWVQQNMLKSPDKLKDIGRLYLGKQG